MSDIVMSSYPWLGLAAVQLASSCIDVLSLYNTAVQCIEQHELCWAVAVNTYFLLAL